MRYFLPTLLLSIFNLAFCQNEADYLKFTDAKGEKYTFDILDSSGLIPFTYESDTLYLSSVYDSKFTSIVQNPHYNDEFLGAVKSDSNLTSFYKPRTPCVICNAEEIKIIDSIDVNKDGVKELFLFREWNCKAPFNHTITIPYNPQSQMQQLCQYEVWDLKSKKQLFYLKSKRESTFPISVNVISSIGYSFDVNINKNGSIFIPNWRKDPNPHFVNQEKVSDVEFIYSDKIGCYEESLK